MNWVIYATLIVAGLFVGSFLNVVIYRGPALWGLVDTDRRARGTLLLPPSRCPSCQRHLRYHELAPLISYIALRGRCRSCGNRISRRYPLVEICGALAAALSMAAFGVNLAALGSFLFLCALIALAAIDHETGYLPDALTLPLIAAGLAVNASGGMSGASPIGLALTDALLGAAAGFGSFWAVSTLYRRWRGRDGLGLGDAKLLAAIGAWSGWPALAPTVLFGSCLALAGVLLFARDRSPSADAPVRFGPALCAAGAAVFLVQAVAPEFWP